MLLQATRQICRGGALRRMSTKGRPVNIEALQSKFNAHPNLHGAENPTYLKMGGPDVMLTAAGLGGVTIGFLMVLKGLANMSLGVNKLR